MRIFTTLGLLAALTVSSLSVAQAAECCKEGKKCCNPPSECCKK